MNELEILPKNTLEIYQNEFDHMVFSCTDELRYRQDEIQSGPEYKIKTSKGETLGVRVLYLEGGGSEPYSSKPCFRKFYLFAYNQANELVAQRISMLFRYPEFLVGQGRIDVLRRGDSIALPLELVYFDVLQRQANITTLPIIHQVQNSNNKEVEDTRTLYSGRRDGQIIIAQKEEENRRWVKLYGPSGKLGFDDRLCRTFYPDYNNNDPFPVRASVSLRREEIPNSNQVRGVIDSVKYHTEKEWEKYTRFAIERVFADINRLSEKIGKYYK